MYERGLGVPQDNVEALKWLQLAADQGYTPAQCTLGVKYEFGFGVPQDYAEALKWFRLAAGQVDAGAQNSLGVMYDNGNGVSQDYVGAHMWFNIASANGFEYAGKRRDEIAAKMTPPDISEAQRRARVCLASNYQDCD